MTIYTDHYSVQFNQSFAYVLLKDEMLFAGDKGEGEKKGEKNKGEGEKKGEKDKEKGKNDQEKISEGFGNFGKKP